MTVARVLRAALLWAAITAAFSAAVIVLAGRLYAEPRGRCTQVDPASLIWTVQGWSLAMGDGHVTVQHGNVKYWGGPAAVCIPPKGMPTLWLPSSAFPQSAHFIGQEHAWLERRRNGRGEFCCGPTDCQQVPADEVFSHRDGIELSQRFGGYIVPGRDIQISEDGRYWACTAPVYGGGKRMRCFFAPLHGS